MTAQDRQTASSLADLMEALNRERAANAKLVRQIQRLALIEAAARRIIRTFRGPGTLAGAMAALEKALAESDKEDSADAE